jgi:hypothetical protein
MGCHVLGRDAKIPHPSLQRRTFVHRPASGKLKAAFDDADAGLGNARWRREILILVNCRLQSASKKRATLFGQHGNPREA